MKRLEDTHVKLSSERGGNIINESTGGFVWAAYVSPEVLRAADWVPASEVQRLQEIERDLHATAAFDPDGLCGTYARNVLAGAQGLSDTEASDA